MYIFQNGIFKSKAVYFLVYLTLGDGTDKLSQNVCKYEGVSKSPRTMLITRKSLVVHKFPARVCCGGVL